MYSVLFILTYTVHNKMNSMAIIVHTTKQHLSLFQELHFICPDLNKLYEVWTDLET